MKKRILFVNDEMRMGGVARVLNSLLKNLDPNQYDMELLVLHKHGELLDDVPKYVKIIDTVAYFEIIDIPLSEIIKTKNISGFFKKVYHVFLMKTGLIKNKIRKIRKSIIAQEYDIEFVAKEGFCTIFTACGNAKKKINWVLTDYKQNNYAKNHMKLFKEALNEIDINIADSNTARDSFKEVFAVNNVIAIHNLMDIEKVKKGMLLPIKDNLINQNEINVISVSRFHPQKSIQRLIEASVIAYNKGLHHKLYLIGSGEEEQYLKVLVETLNGGHIHFLGLQKNPFNYMHQADLFVLSSLYEGFATVVSESLIAGTPVLSTNVAGIEEQITNAYYGWIVDNNQEALNIGLQNALASKDELQVRKKQLANYVYPNNQILNQFIAVFEEASYGFY